MFVSKVRNLVSRSRDKFSFRHNKWNAQENNRVKNLVSWLRGEPAGPVRIELHPTDRCNLNCIFCWRQSDSYGTELSNSRLLSIVEEAHKLGVKEWIISGGGEPLLRPITLKVMALIKKYGMWGQLTTNGTLITEERAKKIVKMRWDQVQISIDSAEEEIQDYLRQGTSFRPALDACRHIASLKKKHKLREPFLGFNTIIHRFNYNKLKDIILMAQNAGAQLVYFEPLYPGYVRGERLELNKKESKVLLNSIDLVNKFAEKHNIATNIRDFFSYTLKKSNFKTEILKPVLNAPDNLINAPCFQHWYLMGIKASGLAGCCSSFEEGEYIQNKSLREVWFGPLFNRIRENMIHKRLPEYCSKCSVVVLKENNNLRSNQTLNELLGGS